LQLLVNKALHAHKKIPLPGKARQGDDAAAAQQA
jgi:hypothetical protein